MGLDTRSATIKDVAKLAGVNASTVSRVLNSRQPVPISAATVQRVRAAADRLRYHPHAAAQALVSRRASTIGLVWFELTDPAKAELARAAQARIESLGYQVYVCGAHTDDSEPSALTRMIAERRVDGILIVASPEISPHVAAQLQDAGATIIAAGPPPLPEIAGSFAGWVTHDNEEGGRLIGQHLGELGHRRVGFIGFESPTPHVRSRLTGFRAGLEAVSVDAVVHEVEPLERGFSSGCRGTDELLDLHPEITAIFANNDIVAMGSLQALWRRGLRVPEDCSLVGFQDLPHAAYTAPPLTTVRVPRARMAELAVDQLLRAIHGEKPAVRETMLPSELVVRESTAPPGGRRG